MELQENTFEENINKKLPSPTKIQFLKIAIGVVAGVAIFLIIKLIF
ncbi:hypothetical protein [Gillisia sp. Hel_I_29]|nr:hypothetical protein [Gillisia sp. Hel_I_29]